MAATTTAAAGSAGLTTGTLVDQILNATNPGRLQQWQVERLQQHYLSKHIEATKSSRTLTMVLSLIVAIATVILANLTGCFALLVGISILLIGEMIGNYIVKRTPDCNINREAADALMTPGFYEYAIQHPTSLATAERVVAAHKVFAGI